VIDPGCWPLGSSERFIFDMSAGNSAMNSVGADADADLELSTDCGR
jgi:hypothetical protein